MPSPLTLVALFFAVSGFLFLITGFFALRRGRVLKLLVTVTFAALLLAVAVLLGTISVATRGYQALTQEEVAAVIRTEPTAPRRFNAHFKFPDGREAVFNLAGDELYVDAHVLKWKTIANFFGLHTAFELDRVAGRYRQLDEEQKGPRTIFPLSTPKTVDIFDLRRRYTLLEPLVDTEYGSATFITADKPQTFELRVSTTGLLFRSSEAN